MADLTLEQLRKIIRDNYLADERQAVASLADTAGLDIDGRRSIADRGADLVATVRETTSPSLMEAFLAEYGLSTKEGLALMCLAEALLRVPDALTIDALIEDKILDGSWGEHAGQSISALVNASTMGLQVTSAVLKEGSRGVNATLKGMVKRMGMPVIRRAVKQVMKELGRQFVLGQDIDDAQKVAAEEEEAGYTYSYDMLGEAAHTARDAEKYFGAYAAAIKSLSDASRKGVRENPGISIKLSALHPRYEQNNHERVMAELVPKVLRLAEMAKTANMGFNIDAEEADRLDISLSIIEAVLSSNTLKGWEGFGVVVQAYGKRAPFVLDWLYALASKLDRKIMVRLVKGAYWDAEIKRAQVMGLTGFPVFTRKEHSDISYVACANKLFGMTDRIYPQFATHNAHTVAAVLHFARGTDSSAYEFQRLHGMGESLHHVLKLEEGINCRIYAPVGVHRDLLAYLVRRLLENGANSSFVNQIVDKAIPPAAVAADPFMLASRDRDSGIRFADDIFGPWRKNSRGYDVTHISELVDINRGRDAFAETQWQAGEGDGAVVTNPARPDDIVGSVVDATPEQVADAFSAAETAWPAWSALSAEARATLLEKTADLYEAATCEFFAILTREAGKSLEDGIAEVREAVDFLRYYAAEARRRDGRGDEARGTFVCISPWNFPLAIFTGQIAAALVTGNAVLAKPAEQTPLVAAKAVALMHEAGIPQDIIQLLPGDGATVGAALTSDPRLAGVCFTGSTETAQIINRSMAQHCDAAAPLIAETGGLNAMIVDSTALPEQAVADVIASAFQSAGQRCSALRMLYVQKEIEGRFLDMLYGAMEELSVGNPWELTTDVGPVIDEEARAGIRAWCKRMEDEGRLLKKIDAPADGNFVSPSLFRVSGIEELEREIFGPVLHFATFEASELDNLVETINGRGFGLTMGLHTRIDERADHIRSIAKVGNLYVNRNQIGAVVGCQPFGGEGLSGTGPKAGGPEYLDVFVRRGGVVANMELVTGELTADLVSDAVVALQNKPLADRARLAEQFQAAFPDHCDLVADCLSRLDSERHDAVDLPSPVGESNNLVTAPVGNILLVGDDPELQIPWMLQALYCGNRVVICTNEPDRWRPVSSLCPVTVLEGIPAAEQLANISGIQVIGVACSGNYLTAVRHALASREGPILPLLSGVWAPYRMAVERHCCTDTTASGGDAALLGGQAA